MGSGARVRGWQWRWQAERRRAACARVGETSDRNRERYVAPLRLFCQGLQQVVVVGEGDTRIRALTRKKRALTRNLTRLQYRRVAARTTMRLVIPHNEGQRRAINLYLECMYILHVCHLENEYN